MTEAEAIRSRYARRSAVESADAGSQLMVGERLQAMRRLISRTQIDVASAHVLDFGCGAGGSLHQILQLGIPSQNVTGIDLLEERIQEARRRLPSNVRLHCGDVLPDSLMEAEFDIVCLCTVFSSILDHGYRAALASNLWRRVRPGGGVLWYDFCIDNPLNRDVRGVSLRQVKILFPDARTSFERLTLAPPLSRLTARLHPGLYGPLARITLLRTHAIGWLEKSAA